MASVDQNQNTTQDETMIEELTWGCIDKVETVVIEFKENLQQRRPYCMDISWNYTVGRDHIEAHVDRNYDEPGHFNEDIAAAASRAVNTRTLRVLYPDTRRGDMYPKLGSILPKFMAAIRLNATVTFDKENLYGFIITFGGEVSTSPKLIQDPAGFDVIADFEGLDMMQQMTYKMYIWDFSDMLNFEGSGGGFMGSQMFLGIDF